MKSAMIGCAFILLVVVVWLRFPPLAQVMPGTLYYHQIDDRYAFRAYTEYSSFAGTVVYCETLHRGRRLGNPMWLGKYNTPGLAWQFQTVVTADASMAALVPQDKPFWILILVDLHSSETSKRTGSEGSPDAKYDRRLARLLGRFRTLTGEPRYECSTFP